MDEGDGGPGERALELGAGQAGNWRGGLRASSPGHPDSGETLVAWGGGQEVALVVLASDGHFLGVPGAQVPRCLPGGTSPLPAPIW